MATTHTEASAVLMGVRSRTAADLELVLTISAAASIGLSIAVSQILLGGALLIHVISRRPFQFPPFMLPVGLFWIWTIVSIAASTDPSQSAHELKKLFIFAIVPLLYENFQPSHMRRLIVTWTLFASASAAVAFGKFLVRWRDAVTLHAPLYDYILDGRISGFQGHWMTFGGVQMITLLMLTTFLLFGDPRPWKAAGWACAALIWAILILSLTRGIIFAGVPAGVAVLLWASRQWRLLGALMLVSLALGGFAPIRERAVSVLFPHGDTDSNSRRILMMRTGLSMIRQHPLLGIGPQEVESHFVQYLPLDAPNPLPKGWYGHLHNVFLQYAAERGLPALALFGWIFVQIIRDARRARFNEGPGCWWLHGVLAVSVAVIAEGMFEHNLGDSEILTMFLTVVTCGYTLHRASPKLFPEALETI